MTGRAMKHVVNFSGGIGSWAAAKRVVERHGASDVTLLFADTMFEDDDLYRFLDEAAANVFRNMPPNLVRIADGRTPWDVFFDERFLGNSLIDPCSKILKRQLLDRWMSANCDPTETICYVGVDWSERHRFYGDKRKKGLRARKAEQGWTYEAPMCDAPYLTKGDMIRQLEAEGIDRPRLYEWGFTHNNCGGFCVKAGIRQFSLLWARKPDFYRFNEDAEQRIRAFLCRDDISILTEDRAGKTYPLTLRDLRLRLEAASASERQMMMNFGPAGGCGCAIDDETGG